MRRVAAAAAWLLLVACGGGRSTGVPTTTSSSTTTTSATSTTALTSTTVAVSTSSKATTSTSAREPPPAAAPFVFSIDNVTAADLGASWHDGCPVDPPSLRMLTVTFVGFDDAEHTGNVVVNADVANDVVEVFRQLHASRFPLRKMKPIFTQAEYDDFETPDDNSTGFSCRKAVNSSSNPSWSQHAYGHAIDINPIENPYIEGNRVIPSRGAAYTDRSDVRPGMAVPGSVVVKAFRSVGWGWGASYRDYQHFSTTGQ